MRVTCEPTPEVTEIPIDGHPIKFRIWSGVTDQGTKIELYVFAITPDDETDSPRLKTELPEFMGPTRKLHAIGDHPKEE